jgi:hypothetical protein
LLALALTGAGSGSAGAATCPYSQYHYYASAQSGTVNNGTGAYEQTWTTWTLNGHSNGFSNESVWTIDNNNPHDALEVGFATGYEGESGGFTTSMYPYYTVNDDTVPSDDEYDDSNVTLPTDAYIWNSATSNGTNSWAYVNSRKINELTYDVPQPRLGFEQTEVNYHDITMGGGGSSITAEWQNASGQWNDWAYINGKTDAQDPGNGNTITPAGYGYFIDLYQPNGTLQGGPGQAC